MEILSKHQNLNSINYRLCSQMFTWGSYSSVPYRAPSLKKNSSMSHAVALVDIICSLP